MPCSCNPRKCSPGALETREPIRRGAREQEVSATGEGAREVATRMNKHTRKREGGKLPVPPGPAVRARQVASGSLTKEMVSA